MTLIMASFPEDTPPVLAADCLATGAEGSDVNLPSGRNEEGQYVGVHKELVRKLYILRPNFAILCAGNGYIAGLFLRELKERLVQRDYNDQEIVEILNKLKSDFGSNTKVMRETSFIAVIAKNEGKTFRYWCLGQITQLHLPRLGMTFCAGSGVDYLQQAAKSYSKPEELTPGEWTPDKLTQCRIVMLCQEFIANEFTSHSDELPLNHFFGGFMEYCYYSIEQRSFLLVNKVTTLFWCVDYNYFRNDRKVHFFFGHAPREKNESMDDFGIVRPFYNQNGLTIEAYRNLSKTLKGHLVKRERYKVENLVDSLNVYDEDTSGKFTFNLYSIFNDERTDRNNRYMYLEYNIHNKFVDLKPLKNGKFHLTIERFAFDVSANVVREFLWRRERELRVV